MRKHLWMRTVCAAALTLTFAVPAFAGQWNASAYGWWYDNGDGTYASPGWHWIDGNNDGTVTILTNTATVYPGQQRLTVTGWMETVPGWSME